MNDKKKDSVPRPVQIAPTKEFKSQRIYANYLLVNHGPGDFTLTFCDITPPLTPDDANKINAEGTVKASIQVEVAVPVNLVEPMIEALKINYELYKKRYGDKK